MPYLIDGYNLLMALRKLRLDEPPDILANERAWLARHLQELLEESGKTSETVTSKSIQLGKKVAAKPTGQGLIDKQTLISRGHNVSTN